jgi:plastocyanin domain-containing protein
MFKKTTFLGSLVGFGFLLGAISGAIAAETHPHEKTTAQSTQFQRIEQPLTNKILVTLGGVGLIGLELWWFLLSQTKSHQAKSKAGIQELTITVDGGYEPSQILVQAGQPVRLNFYRKDPSSCLEEIRFPDFHIAQELPLNQTTPIEFNPQNPGKYEFTCGMNMFRGTVEVQPANLNKVTSQPLPANENQETSFLSSSVEAKLTPEGIQDATVAVNKGYQPQRIIVEVGQPVHLHFQRQNASPCYDQLIIPEFDIFTDLALNETTTVEFIPEQAGEYEFMCGMKMNRGIIEVRSSHSLHSSSKIHSHSHS